MEIVHIVGRRNHGKTRLITELVREFTSRGLDVATAKHCGHAHELDTPGKDSFHHRTSGAAMAAVITPAMCAVYRPRTSVDDVYADVAQWAGNAALLLVEGDADGPGKKLEVWRAELGGSPLALERDDIAAVITNDSSSLKRDPSDDSLVVGARGLRPPLATRAKHHLGACGNGREPLDPNSFQCATIRNPAAGVNIPVWPRQDTKELAHRILDLLRQIALRDMIGSSC